MDLFIDLTIMLMLVITIIYAWRLNIKLNAIRNHKLQLKSNIEEFHNATEIAVKAVRDLQKQGKTVCQDIDSKISKARLTADEIDILLSSVNKKISEAKHTQELSAKQENGYDEFLEEPYNGNFSISSLRRKLPDREQKKPASKFNSINEAELAKALREKQYRDALVG